MENIEVLFSDDPDITRIEEGSFFVTHFSDQNEPWAYKLPYDMGYQIGMYIKSRGPLGFVVSNYKRDGIKFKQEVFDSDSKTSLTRGLSASELDDLYFGIKDALEGKEPGEDDFNPGSTGGDMHPN